tara:strand:+ start:44 stop:784 length:741 start_codon:yes stop_codon:yes gene_type:complete
MTQKTKILTLVLFLSFCSQQNELPQESTLIEVDENETSIADNQEPESSETTTSVVVEQVEKFSDNLFTINQEKSTASYLAPKDFLNSNLEIVRGTTNVINGGFELTLDECDQADSCLYISNLLISVDLSTLKSGSSIRDGAIKNNWLESKLFPSAIYKIEELVLPNNNFDSKIDETVVGVLTIRNIEVNIPFSVTAYMQNDSIFISGVTEIDTTWFGFDAPTKFNAWEVLNPIGIEIDFVAEKSSG